MLPLSAVVIVPPSWWAGIAWLPADPPLAPLLPPLLPQPARPSMLAPATNAVSASHKPGRLFIEPSSRRTSGSGPSGPWDPQSLTVQDGAPTGKLERRARVESVAQAVAEQVERQRHDQQHQARPDDQPGLDRVELHGLVEQLAPA